MAPIGELEPEDLMAGLGQDKEVQELLLRKIREKGLAGKLLTELLKSSNATLEEEPARRRPV
jgi:hypothetical protein